MDQASLERAARDCKQGADAFAEKRAAEVAKRDEKIAARRAAAAAAAEERQEKAAALRDARKTKRVRASRTKYEEAKRRFRSGAESRRSRSLGRGSSSSSSSSFSFSSSSSSPESPLNELLKEDEAWMARHPRRAASEPRPSAWLPSPPRSSKEAPLSPSSPSSGGLLGSAATLANGGGSSDDAEAMAMAAASDGVGKAIDAANGVVSRVRRLFRLRPGRRSDRSKTVPSSSSSPSTSSLLLPVPVVLPRDENGFTYAEFMAEKTRALAAGCADFDAHLTRRRADAAAAAAAAVAAQEAREKAAADAVAEEAAAVAAATAAAAAEEERRKRQVRDVLARAAASKKAGEALLKGKQKLKQKVQLNKKQPQPPPRTPIELPPASELQQLQRLQQQPPKQKVPAVNPFLQEAGLVS